MTRDINLPSKMVAMLTDVKKTPASKLCLNISIKEWIILAALGSVNFSSGICGSLQGPIYPEMAESKGVRASEYGMVFGIYALVAFFICPIFGKYMDKIGSKLLINCGMILAGLCCILFGLIEYVDSQWGFLALSFVLRIVESLGSSASFMASFAITAVVFTNSIAKVYALLECSYGLGFVLGPTIGGYLFEVGGFVLPFLVIGSLMLLDGLFIFFALPKIEQENKEEKPPVPIMSVLKLVPVVLDFFSVMAAHISMGFNMATLEPHLRQFDISKEQVGAIFAISAATYLLSTPLVGILCDSKMNTKKTIFVGASLIVTGFSLIGPLPFVSLKPHLYLVCLGLIFHGLGMSCIVVPGFIGAIRSAVRCGLPDDISTYSVVTGISTASVNMGTFIGPSIAGLLFDLVGYRKSTLFVIVVHLVLMLATLVYVSTKDVCKEMSNSQEELSNAAKIEKCDTTTDQIGDTEKGRY